MIAGYKLLRKIGSGGFGQIYLGEEEISGRKVAIKTLKESADIFENTKHEIHIISQFYHPNIVTYHTTLLDGETVYIVMEYCKKGSLSEKIVQKPIQLDEALYIVQTIAKTLKFVHDKGIVHHDVKPANILLAEDNQIKLTTKYKIDEEGKDVDEELNRILHQGLEDYLEEGTSYETFKDDNIQSSMKVGPTIAHDIKVQAVWAVLFALVVVFLYIFGRFRNWQYGLGALVALLHDVTIILGIFSLFYTIMPFSLEIDQAFIAAILTVVGYSINDTVVVYDRVREYINTYPKRGRFEIMNSALNSTLSRTFSTSLSTFVVLLSIFLFGGEVIRGFAFALLVGVVVGTYSSLFVASPVVYDTVHKKLKGAIKGKQKSPQQKGKQGSSQQESKQSSSQQEDKPGSSQQEDKQSTPQQKGKQKSNQAKGKHQKKKKKKKKK